MENTRSPRNARPGPCNEPVRRGCASSPEAVSMGSSPVTLADAAKRCRVFRCGGYGKTASRRTSGYSAASYKRRIPLPSNLDSSTCR
jgi:hypothetical protein